MPRSPRAGGESPGGIGSRMVGADNRDRLQPCGEPNLQERSTRQAAAGLRARSSPEHRKSIRGLRRAHQSAPSGVSMPPAACALEGAKPARTDTRSRMPSTAFTRDSMRRSANPRGARKMSARPGPRRSRWSTAAFSACGMKDRDAAFQNTATTSTWAAANMRAPPAGSRRTQTGMSGAFKTSAEQSAHWQPFNSGA